MPKYNDLLIENLYVVSPFLPIPVSFAALARGVLRDQKYESWYHKTRVPGLADGENRIVLRS